LVEICKERKNEKYWGFTGAEIFGKSPRFYAPLGDTWMAARRQVQNSGGCR